MTQNSAFLVNFEYIDLRYNSSFIMTVSEQSFIAFRLWKSVENDNLATKLEKYIKEDEGGARMI